MRRTILARICTFDTSVKDPTEEQLHESVEFLETVMEMGAPQNQWEQQAVQRIHDVLAAALENGMTQSAPQEPAPVDEPVGDETQTQAAIGGGMTEEEEPASLDAPPQEGENGHVEGDNGGSISTEAVNEATSEASGSQQTTMTEGASEPAKTEATKEGPQRDESGYFRDDAGRVISQRAAQKLYDAKKAEESGSPAKGTAVAAQSANSAPAAASAPAPVAETQPSSAELAGAAQSDSPKEPEFMVTRSKYSKLTKGEIAWQQRKAASTAAWKKRTGRA
jgi:hypothetical protein